jgi:hypothetical protein
MACSRGKASPDDHTKLRLFADSGGFCQKPGCARELFIDLKEDRIHIAEIAHIIAASDDGPRGDPALGLEDRGDYENLILLCPACHTEIDKAPSTYPDNAVARWKREHKDRLRQLFGVKEYDSRATLRSVVEPILTTNKAIFDQYGPHLEYSENPESDEAHAWRRKVIMSILPNNRRLLALLDANRILLNNVEKGIVEEFRQHIDDLTARHFETKLAGGGKRFPRGMSSIAEGEAPYE